MFTGIIEHVGTVVQSRTVSGGRRLRLDVGHLATGCRLGDSICVSGVCLTVCELNSPLADFDVIKETLDASILGSLREGDRVNLERSLRADGRIDGHFVQGHVDGIAAVDQVVSTGAEHVVWLRASAPFDAYLIPKGSIAIDGVSLTIAAVEGTRCSVALIPTTLERTTLGKLRVGSKVNVESDIIARTVVHHLSRVKQVGGLTIDSLRKAGFA